MWLRRICSLSSLMRCSRSRRRTEYVAESIAPGAPVAMPGAAALPDARLQVQAGVGHVAMTEAPEATARAVLGLVEETAERGR